MDSMSRMQIIGALEQNVGQARIAFAVHANFPDKHFGDKSEAEWLENPGTDISRTLYSEYVKGRERLELWEFLLNAARNWQPGDNVVDTWNDSFSGSFTDPCKSDGSSPYPVQ